MKKYKVYRIVIFLSLVVNVAASQTRFSLRAGVNFFTIGGRDGAGYSWNNSVKPGFHFGMQAGFPLWEDLVIQPELVFSVKGAKTRYPASDVRTNLNYLELPLYIIYNPEQGKGRLLLGFGPYVAYGLGGKLSDGTDQVKVKFRNVPGTAYDEVYFTPVDAGANILVGYAFSNHVTAQLNAQMGLVNIAMADVEGSSKNMGFGFSLGYRFGG